MLVDIIAGARPNFMKIAPIIEAIQLAASKGENIQYRLIHTGQHFDKKMSGDFFEQLGIPEPDVNLQAGGGTQAEQTAAIMIGFEKELMANPADLVLVVGDVTSTMACSIVAKKLNTKVAHVEAGIRSFDLTMPEEINRMVTDSITDYFFTTSSTANENLLKLGTAEESMFFVGNTMIDTLLKNMDRFKEPLIWAEAGLTSKNYIVTTLHRPANVDGENELKSLVEEIIANAQGLPIIFPVHPRTAKVLKSIGLYADNLFLIEPLSYLEFNFLVKHAKVVITDSGGITEETTVMSVPCITLRDNTERPETCTIGTNKLIGTDPKNIAPAFKQLFDGEWQKGAVPEKWDGKAAERIVDALLKL
jgi:UDP-N-acetylglucosamine 2-epimerase (non-hydrolysing)